MSKRYALISGLIVGFVAIAAVFVSGQLQNARSPEQVAQAFFFETYTHDFSAAWELVSAADQVARGREEYLASNRQVSPAQAALYEQLASWGDFQVVALVSSQPDQATVTANIRFPNNAQPEFIQLVEQADAEAVGSGQLIERLIAMHQQDQLQFFEGDIGFNLVRQDDGWRVVQHWGGAVTVRLSASVSPNLPWEFYPVESDIQAIPGELVKASYIARNQSDRAITAKAIHEVGPPAVANYFQTIQCFCFTEQTLQPGEQREMIMLFQIDFSLPAGAAIFQNRYVFYSLEEFPADG